MKFLAVFIGVGVVLLLAPGCPGGGDGSDAGEDAAVQLRPDAGPDAGALTLSAPGPLVWYLDAVNAYNLQATGGTPPYTWQVTEKPQALSWLTLEASGTLTGTATALTDPPTLSLGVRAIDAVGLSGQGSFGIEIRACNDGTTEACGATALGDQCVAGTRTCSGGRFGECQSTGAFSDLFYACGPSCGACDLQRATACVEGRCQCGDVPSCGDADTCCATDGGSPRYCATLGSDVANCGACGRTCLPDAGDPGASIPTCSAGECGSYCADGSMPCDGACRWADNMQHCGGCNRVCPENPPNTVAGSANCASTVCAATCIADHADCNADIPLDGCEAALKTSSTHCGTCGNACSADRTCRDGSCCAFCGEFAAADGGSHCCGALTCEICRVPDPDNGGFMNVPCCR